ncbi:MAG TPA: siroheme synthase [Dehalococcoidia bacterium]|jgi:precorrin-2 dehydrogenase/sirohydrochlorin ferrochelatase|nr:siroheme synthase [Dehalococcoidia bacterium]|tara:strand:- start:4300 stop:4998 length:699 start_codon:yes stop_codon:yes gene_type:complete
MDSYYPVYLNLKGKKVLIIGGGEIAAGKVPALQESEATIEIISPIVTDAIKEYAASGAVKWTEREYIKGDLDGVFVCIAATNVRKVNQMIFDEADEKAVLLNVVDDTPFCSFIAPAIVKKGPVTLAISTGGVSPALARKFRESLTVDPVLDWSNLSEVLSKARNEVKREDVYVEPQRWQCCIDEDLMTLYKEKGNEEALDFLLGKLIRYSDSRMCPSMGECVPGGCSVRRKE